MTDAEREAQIRERCERNPTAGLDEDRFLLRLLDEARAEIAQMRNEIDRMSVIFGQKDLEIARLQAPPGAAAMERARRALPPTFLTSSAWGWSPTEIDYERLGRAIEQAEVEARAKAIEEVMQVMADYGHVTHNTTITPEDGLIDRVRALAKPSG